MYLEGKLGGGVGLIVGCVLLVGEGGFGVCRHGACFDVCVCIPHHEQHIDHHTNRHIPDHPR